MIQSKSVNQVDLVNFMSCFHPPQAVIHCYHPQRRHSKQNCYSSLPPLGFRQQMIHDSKKQG